MDPFREVAFPGFGCVTVPRTIIDDRMADLSLFGALVGWARSGRSLFPIFGCVTVPCTIEKDKLQPSSPEESTQIHKQR